MAVTRKVLIIDDEKVAVRNLEYVMGKEGYAVTGTQSSLRALSLLEKENFDVVLTDLRMDPINGLEILRTCRERHPDTEVIIITGYASLESAVDAMKEGAFYYIAKPLRLEDIRKVVGEAMEKIRLKRENRQLREEIENQQGKFRIITQDVHMQKLIELARQIAPTDCNVLITGESGTGKELFARFVHSSSNRHGGPFLAINCGAFSEELLTNELFGHGKEAFTGAISEKRGLIEAASDGTLFLDEITEMPPAMQTKLLRVIQEREVLRLGETTPQPVDVRFVAATNRHIQEEVKNGGIRQDLYFRLNVVNLHIPPLAQRRGDIPLLAHYFLSKFSVMYKKEVTEIAPDALDVMCNYDFPGNVRELQNIIERGVALAHRHTMEFIHLPEDLRELNIRTFRRKDDGRLPTLEEQEREYIRWIFAEAKGNQTTAAQWLGIDRVSLWRKLKKFSIKYE